MACRRVCGGRWVVTHATGRVCRGSADNPLTSSRTIFRTAARATSRLGQMTRGFKQSGCLPFWQDPGPFAKNLAVPGQPFGQGDFKVGPEVAPGIYSSPGAPTANPKRGCFWARPSGFGGTLAEVIQNSVSTSGTQTVTIDASDVGFTSDNCGTWTKIGSARASVICGRCRHRVSGVAKGHRGFGDRSGFWDFRGTGSGWKARRW